MSVTGRLSRTLTLGGQTFSESKSFTSDGAATLVKSVSAAKTGVIANSGAQITGQASHGITTGATIDVYWSTGQRYGVTVGTVSGTTIPISSGTGDSIPADATAVTMMVQQTEDFLITGDNLDCLVIEVGAKAVVSLKDAGGIELTKIFNEAGVFIWHSGLDDANPVSGDDIISVTFTHGDSSAAKNVKVGALYTS